jgi:predicted NBD/HSP70 family sugar kinase
VALRHCRLDAQHGEDVVDAGIGRSEITERADSRTPRGTNQSGMRDYNERLVLSLVRHHGSLAKSDIARMTGLSAQTVSVIMRELEADSLLVRGEPVRGKVGQPSVPMSLNPEGALFLGLKIGRRSADLVLIDFLGRVRAMRHHSYRYPVPVDTVAFVKRAVAEIRAGLAPEQDQRIAGLGIAMPHELWNWADAVGAPRAVMDEWKSADIRGEVAATVPFPVFLQNDATAACGAELVFGNTRGLRDFLYFYVGSFIGGGVVLNGSLHAGQTGNAGALGSMPVPDGHGGTTQLIDIASIATLERALPSDGDWSLLWTSPEDWGDLGPALDVWIDGAAHAIAHAVVAASAVIDFQAAIVDGWIPLDIRRRIVAAVRLAVMRIDAEGIALPEILEGTVGQHARALWGARLPLAERFLIGQASVAAGL